MAEIQEVVKDTTETIKKEFKKKPVFYTALAVVIVFSIYKLMSGGDEGEEVVTNAYVPTGYDGYPAMSDSMLDDYESMLDGSYYEGAYGGGGTSSGGFGSDGTTSGGTGTGETVTNTERVEVDTYYESYRDLMGEYEDLQQELLLMQQNQLVLDSADPTAVYDNYGTLIYSENQPYKVIKDDSSAGRLQFELETKSNKDFYNAVVGEMKANSALWNASMSVQEQQELHNKNEQLAKYIGATYNSSSGTWTGSDGSQLYGAQKSTQTVTYDKNTDYAAAIQQAKAIGASQSVIDTLTAQRNAKIAGENLNQDGTKKSSSSSSSKSSTSSGSKTSTTTKNTSSSVSYDKNTDYAQKIKDAKASGASSSVISKLQAQREAKIKGENLNNDGTKKK